MGSQSRSLGSHHPTRNRGTLVRQLTWVEYCVNVDFSKFLIFSFLGVGFLSLKFIISLQSGVSLFSCLCSRDH